MNYSKQHQEANALYEAYIEALKVYFYQAQEELEGLLGQYLEGVKNTAPIFLKTNTIFPPIPIPPSPLAVSLFGFSEGGIKSSNGLFLRPDLSSIYPFKHEGNTYYLLYAKNYQRSGNKVILSADEPLYLELKEKVIEWTESQDTTFNNNDDRIRFFDDLVKKIQKAIKEKGINYKNVDRNKDEYPPFLSKKGAKDFFVCIHQAVLNYVIIKQVIEKLQIKGIEVLILNNFSRHQDSGDWHCNNLLVDAKSGKIIAIVEAYGLYQPTKPITIEQLLEERHILAKNMQGQYSAYYLPNALASLGIQLYPKGFYAEESLFREHFFALEESLIIEHFFALRGNIEKQLPLPDFSFKNLEGKDFSKQNLSSALFIGAILRGVILSGADLTRANLKEADLRGATFNQKTILPENLIKKPPTFPFSEEQINSLNKAEAAKAQAFNQSIANPNATVMNPKTNSRDHQVG